MIRGSAVNNDGADKVGFTASSVWPGARDDGSAGRGQVDAGEIIMSSATAPAPPIGDPMEIGALTRAFRTATTGGLLCHRLGEEQHRPSRAMRGHGRADQDGLVAAQPGDPAVSLHYRKANPKIDFDNSPFFVNTQTREWMRNGHARHAGVNSLGLGGTNAFLVLEEAPEPAAVPPFGRRRNYSLSRRKPATRFEHRFAACGLHRPGPADAAW